MNYKKVIEGTGIGLGIVAGWIVALIVVPVVLIGILWAIVEILKAIGLI